MAIAYHKTREAVAAGMVHSVKAAFQNNCADFLTKSFTTGNVFGDYMAASSETKVIIRQLLVEEQHWGDGLRGVADSHLVK
eukprot:14664148-Ditylum_brightwellii.AAC.1